MAYSNDYKNAYRTDLKEKLTGVFETVPARLQTAEMKVFTGEFVNDTGAVVPAGEEIFVGRLPKNVTIRSAFYIHQTSVGADVAGNADVGLFGLDEVAIAAGDEILSAAAIRVSENVDILLDQDYTIAVELTAAVANGSKVRVVIMYTEM